MFMGNMMSGFMGGVGMMLFFFMNYLFLMKKIIIFEYDLGMVSSVELNLILYFDWMSLFFLCIVMFISSVVMLYIKGYMNEDSNLMVFYLLVVCFIFSMFLLILSMNLFWLIVGWDMLGGFSYLLIIYYKKFSSLNSGMVTILMNRVGDISLILSVMLIIKEGSVNFIGGQMSMMVLFMLMVSSMTKSSQYPFSLWLPLAMAAPTPVSALVHSSTLVAAGVYLIIRVNNFSGSKVLLLIVVMTMFISSMMANVENDLKKIIAMSTMSQLSFMFFVVYLNSEVLAFFHMLIHALFKSLMFLCAGVIIHYKHGDQDIRKMGGLSKMIPNIFLSLNLSIMCLCGVLFFSGYFSKDKIIESMIYSGESAWIFIFIFFSVGMTLMYSLRISYYSYFVGFMEMKMIYKESINKSMEVSVLLLSFYSIYSGYFYLNLYLVEMGYFLMSDMKKFFFFNLLMYMLIYLFVNLSWDKLVWVKMCMGDMFYLKSLFMNFIEMYYKAGEWIWFNVDKGVLVKLVVLNLMDLMYDSLKSLEGIYKSVGFIYIFYVLILFYLYF